MKFYSWFSRLAILIMLFMPNALTHAIKFPIDIHELVDKSDIVFIGRVTGSQCVTNIDTQDLSEPILGGLHIITD